MSWRWMGVFAWVFAGCSGESTKDDTEGDTDDTEPALVGQIEVEPSELQFTQLPAGSQEVQAFLVSNVGQADLTVEVAVEGDAFSLDSASAFVVAPGEAVPVNVAFSPLDVFDEGKVLVSSSDPTTPRVEVPVYGFGLVPVLDVSPSTYIFPDPRIGCSEQTVLDISNEGNTDLVITDVFYATDADFRLFGPSLPVTLAPGDATAVTITFNPTETSRAEATLEITSNDPRGVFVATQEGVGAHEPAVTETFTEPRPPPLDLLIAIDQSCSMEQDNYDEVVDAFPALISALDAATPDWQLLLVTEANGCGSGGIATPATPNLAQALTARAFDAQPAYPLTEALLGLSTLAMAQSAPGGCNEGFLRPGATTQVVVISDEREQSGEDAAHWVAEMQALLGDPTSLVISGVLDSTLTCGDGSGGGGYEEAVQLTGGTILDICLAWGADAADLLTLPVSGTGGTTYALSEQAVAGTLTVEVDGSPVTNVALDASGLFFTVNDPVLEGEEVTATYSPLPVCD